jgi:hypothetical protein
MCLEASGDCNKARLDTNVINRAQKVNKRFAAFCLRLLTRADV